MLCIACITEIINAHKILVGKSEGSSWETYAVILFEVKRPDVTPSFLNECGHTASVSEQPSPEETKQSAI
jgi:hypothetical protein